MLRKVSSRRALAGAGTHTHRLLVAPLLCLAHPNAIPKRPGTQCQATAVSIAVPVLPGLSLPGLSLPTSHQHCVSPTRERAEHLELGWAHDFSSHYHLEARLGAGEFAVCWLARPVTSAANNAAPVAVKVMPKNRLGHSRADTLARIAREAVTWTTCAASSSYVAKLLGLYEDDGQVYMVQELCHGGDLTSMLQGAPLQEALAATVMRGVLGAISECHAHGIAHNDIKPANLLLKERIDWHAPAVPGAKPNAALAEVRAIDFGCSVNLEERASAGLSRRMGTPVYMAPECHMCTAGSTGLGVDVWAAGVILYQMLSGKYPFWDVKREAVDHRMPAYQIMLATCQAPIKYSGPEWAGVSRDAKELLSMMLDRNPATRISAADALHHRWFVRLLGGAAHAPAPARTAATDAARQRAVAAFATLDQDTDTFYAGASLGTL